MGQLTILSPPRLLDGCNHYLSRSPTPQPRPFQLSNRPLAHPFPAPTSRIFLPLHLGVYSCVEILRYHTFKDPESVLLP